MILPGISGSFILLLLGSYQTVLTGIKEMNFGLIGLFAAGCVVGLLSFSKILNWLFKHFHNLTVAILTGFLIGSLNKIWPWKYTTVWRTTEEGIKIPFIQENIAPVYNQLLQASLFAILGLSILIVLEKLGKNKVKV